MDRKITLELMEQELAVITYALGITKFEDLQREADEYGLSCLDAVGHYRLWEYLEQILFSKEVVVSQRQ